MQDLVVLIPGIMGTTLRRDGRVVWGLSASSMARAVLSRGKSVRRDLMLGNDPLSHDDGMEVGDPLSDLHLLPGFWKIDGYSALADLLRSRFSLTEGRNFFRFGYDWRRDNRIAAQLLSEATSRWLDEWRKTNPDAKLVLVAHSMGGLVARYFIEVLGGWRDTRMLISVGTPFRGSLNALGSLAGGLSVGSRHLFDLSEAVRSFPSVYQLLPIYSCYDPGDGSLQKLQDVGSVPNLNSTLAQDAWAFHEQINAAVARNRNCAEWRSCGYRTRPIIGVAQATWQSARYTAGGVHLSEEIDGIFQTGDGTVPRISATPIEDSNAGHEMFAATRHSSLQNATAVLTHMTALIEGPGLNLGSYRTAGVKISLEVPDIVEPHDRALLRAKPTRTPVELVATVTPTQPGGSNVLAHFRACGDRWYEARLPELPPGAYRVDVAGPGVEPCRDSFVVAQPAGAGEEDDDV